MVPVNAMAATPRNTIAPAGIGRTIDPTMVPRKIASSRHDLTVIPSGTGARRIADDRGDDDRPAKDEVARGEGFLTAVSGRRRGRSAVGV